MIDLLAARRGLACVLFSSVIAALGAELGAQAAVEEAPKPQVGDFSWPVPGRVQVTERALKRGKSVVMRYFVETRPAKDGKNVMVWLRDFEFLEVAGRDATTPQMRKALAKALEATASIPAFIVDKAGAFTGMTDLEPMIDVLGKIGNKSAAELAETKKVFARPAMKRAMQASISKFWNTWVGAWVGWSHAPGEKTQFETSLPLGGAQLPAMLDAEHKGASKRFEGAIHLHMKTLAQGAAAKKAYIRFMIELVGEQWKAKHGKLPTVEDLTDLRVCTVAEAHLDPKTLRPHSARYRTESRVRSKDDARAKTTVEERSYSFDWKVAASKTGGASEKAGEVKKAAGAAGAGK